MRYEVFCLCDSAADYGGKLSILGCFDTIVMQQVPGVYPFCSIAIRLRIEKSEEGEHPFRITVIDDDGHNLLGPIDGKFAVRIPPGSRSAAVNLVINLQGTQIKEYGAYQIDMAVDGREVGMMEFFVRRPPAPPPPTPA